MKEFTLVRFGGANMACRACGNDFDENAGSVIIADYFDDEVCICSRHISPDVKVGRVISRLDMDRQLQEMMGRAVI